MVNSQPGLDVPSGIETFTVSANAGVRLIIKPKDKEKIVNEKIFIVFDDYRNYKIFSGDLSELKYSNFVFKLVGFFNNLKKKIEVKESQVSSKTIQEAEEKIPKLEKAIEKNPDNFDLLYQLYGYYVDLKNSEKKIECLEKMHKIKPKDAFPLNQLAQIYYSELENPEKGKFYQDEANRLNSNKFL